MRMNIVQGLFNFIPKLEEFTTLEVPPQVFYEVADVTATAKMCLKVD